MNAFAHWSWVSTQTIKVGQFESIEVDVPKGIELFAAFLTPNSVEGKTPVPFLSKILELEQSKLLITTSATLNALDEHFGAEMPLTVMVYGNIKDDKPWKRYLYESLRDFSEQQHTMSLFKLA